MKKTHFSKFKIALFFLFIASITLKTFAYGNPKSACMNAMNSFIGKSKMNPFNNSITYEKIVKHHIKVLKTEPYPKFDATKLVDLAKFQDVSIRLPGSIDTLYGENNTISFKYIDGKLSAYLNSKDGRPYSNFSGPVRIEAMDAYYTGSDDVWFIAKINVNQNGEQLTAKMGALGLDSESTLSIRIRLNTFGEATTGNSKKIKVNIAHEFTENGYSRGTEKYVVNGELIRD